MVQKFAPLVKRQIDYWLWQIAYFPPNHPRYRPSKVEKYRKLVDQFTPLLEHLNAEEGTDLKPETQHVPVRSAMRGAPDWQHQNNELEAPPPEAPPPRSRAPAPAKDQLADLPPELLAELSGGAKAETDPLIQIINKRGGTASLDEILIDLYRVYGEVGKRTLIGNKLYRLGRRKLCWAIPGRKGIYTTTRPAGADDNANTFEDDEGPDAATSEPSIELGAAGSPAGSPNQAPPGGSTPLASTPFRRKLMSETSIPNLWPDKKEGHR